MFGIFFILLYNFSGSIIPFKPLTPKIDYLDAEDPSYAELIEKKWVRKDKIKEANEKIRKMEEEFFQSNSIKEYFIDNKLNIILLYLWITIIVFLTIPIIHILYLRKKLGPFFR
jgi:hypothetical protein